MIKLKAEIAEIVPTVQYGNLKPKFTAESTILDDSSDDEKQKAQDKLGELCYNSLVKQKERMNPKVVKPVELNKPDILESNWTKMSQVDKIRTVLSNDDCATMLHELKITDATEIIALFSKHKWQKGEIWGAIVDMHKQGLKDRLFKEDTEKDIKY